MRIIGIDPGLRNTGWGMIETEGNRLIHVAHGVICPPAAENDSARLAVIHENLCGILTEHLPQHAAIEEVFMARNASSLAKLSMARGVAMCACAGAGLPVAEIAARRIKQNLTGSGRAEKEQVAAMVRRLLGAGLAQNTASPDSPPDSPDALDALAIAIAATHEDGFDAAPGIREQAS